MQARVVLIRSDTPNALISKEEARQRHILFPNLYDATGRPVMKVVSPVGAVV